jgi:hypothetical protein
VPAQAAERRARRRPRLDASFCTPRFPLGTRPAAPGRASATAQCREGRPTPAL